MSISRKNNKRSQVAVVHVQATFNNTIVTFSDLSGNVLCWSSSGKCGFRGAKKGTPYAAGVATNDCAKKAINEYGVKTVSIVLRGPGSGRESVVKSIYDNGLKVTVLKDDTGLPHNGCRSPKRRRV